ncbi:MAG: hypothetical protein E5Y31_25955 [Mesorhizobium sp.]|nr:MAG: hypothetical protein E5Y31_25955 [Mesorhizobium sp.]
MGKSPPLLRPRSATLEDAVGFTSAGAEYVRRILAQMGKPGDTQVRIALYGDDDHPDYIIDEFFHDEDDPDSEGQPQAMFACNGRTHRLYIADHRYEYELWADTGMGVLAVRKLIGIIRGYDPKKPK